jgi:hypothetical protein
MAMMGGWVMITTMGVVGMSQKLGIWLEAECIHFHSFGEDGFVCSP